jgi:hypothetical protein
MKQGSDYRLRERRRAGNAHGQEDPWPEAPQDRGGPANGLGEGGSGREHPDWARRFAMGSEDLRAA